MVDKNRVEGAVENVLGKAEETVGRVAGDESSRTEGLASRTEGLARQAAGNLQSSYGDARESARGLAAQLGEITREQPYWMLLAAGTIGFVLGRCFGSAARRGR